MIYSVVLPDTKPADWPTIREGIRAKILASMGTVPPEAEALTEPPRFEVLERYERHGLRHVRGRYRVVDDEWTHAILVLPEGASPAGPVPCVMTVHGTADEGKLNMLDPVGRPRRAYGIELARRGIATFSPDQYGFGESAPGGSFPAAFEAFTRRYPQWSLDGRRTLEQQRGLDVLGTLPEIRGGGFGVIGNSLGGRAVMYLAAVDERIVAAVSSTGVSPNITNVYRQVQGQIPLSPALNGVIAAGGRTPWEYQEMLALCAPRALLLVEPFNDPYNPYVEPILACFNEARRVYSLLGAAANLRLLVHGDGHDTTDDIREFAYRWLAEHLA